MFEAKAKAEAKALRPRPRPRPRPKFWPRGSGLEDLTSLPIFNSIAIAALDLLAFNAQKVANGSLTVAMPTF